MESILQTVTASSDAKTPEKDISILLDNERDFLHLMDEVVYEHYQQSKENHQNVK